MKTVEQKNKQRHKLDDRALTSLLDQYIQVSQRIDEQLRPEEPDITVPIATNGPIQVLHVSDTHFGSLAVDYQALNKTRDYLLSTPHSYVILYGDLLEGAKSEHLDTTIARTILDVDKQIRGFKVSFLEPLAKKGKILAMVGGYKGHEEWMREKAQVSPSTILAGDLNIPVVRNGGLIDLVRPDGTIQRILAAHNAGGGGSEQNVVGSQRKLVSSPTSPYQDIDVVAAGHNHTRGGIAKEKSISGKTTLLIATGTYKGNHWENPDQHAVRDMAGKLSADTKASTIHYPDSGGRQAISFAARHEDGDELFQAINIWNLAQQKGAMPELLAMIHEKVQQNPIMKIDQESIKARNIDNDPTPHVTNIRYDFRGTKLPIQIVPFSGYRAGSSSSDTQALRELTSLTSGHAFSYAVMLRHMFDAGLSKDENREATVLRLIEEVSPLWKNSSKILGWLFSGSMREDDWKKPLKKNPEGKLTLEDANGFLPGQYIADTADVPLLDNMSEVTLDFGVTSYTLFLLDKLQNSASLDDPFRGLVVVEYRGTENATPHDVIMGGHMPKSGTHAKFNARATMGQQIFVAPGWLAYEHDNGGKGNRTKATPAGDSVIFRPDTKAVYTASSQTESKDLYQALILLCGFTQLGGIEKWVRKLKYSQKRA